MVKITTPSYSLEAATSGDPHAPVRVIVAPGWVDSIDTKRIISLLDTIASRGHYAIAFDPPGTWGSVTANGMAEYTLTNYVRAIEELVASEPDRPTVLIGHCFGATAASLASSDAGNIVGLVSLLNDPDLLRVKIQHHFFRRGVRFPDWESTGKLAMPRRTYGQGDINIDLPWSFALDIKKHDLYSGYRESNVPKLFISGTIDHVSQPWHIFDAYRKAHSPKKFRMTHTNHNYWNDPRRMNRINNMAADFVDSLSHTLSGKNAPRRAPNSLSSAINVLTSRARTRILSRR